MTHSPENALGPLIRKLSKHVDLGEDEIRAIQRLPHQVSCVERNGYVVREGDRPHECAAVASGFLCRSKMTRDGGRQIISVHLQGDLVCAHDYLLGEADHSIQALTKVYLAYIPQEALLKVIEQYPTLARALWRDNLVDASVAREWMLNLGRRSARQRVAHLLCEMAIRSEAAGTKSGRMYALPLTQEQLGDATGLTSVHINRTIKNLRRDSLVTMRHREVHIIDWQGLRTAGDFEANYLHERSSVPIAA